MPTIKQSLKAVYSPEEIKLLIVKDLRERGFEIEAREVMEPAHFEARPALAPNVIVQRFEGYEIRKDMPTADPMPKMQPRGTLGTRGGAID